jgi:hypothetical protein
VSLTGSDALISGLWKTERGGIAMQRALGRLHSLAEHKKYSDNLFFHQATELKRLDKLFDEQGDGSAYVKSLREPYRYGEAAHFREGDNHAPSMWSTHPSNRERELNAKRSYVSLSPVERSAWTLIESKKALKKRLTLIAYDEVFGARVSPGDCLPAEEVHALAKEEEEERKQADHYHGFYENRVVDLGDFGKLTTSLEADPEPDRPKIREKAGAWAGKRLASFMRKYKRVHEDMGALAELAQGTKSPMTFELRGTTYPLREAKRLLTETTGKASEMEKRFKTADRALFRHFFYRTADQPEAREELLRRYRFLLGIQELILSLKEDEGRVSVVMQMLSSGEELTAEQVNGIVAALNAAYSRLEHIEKRCRGLKMPKLQHIAQGDTVASFVLPERLIEPMNPSRIEGAWLMSFVRQLNQVLGRLRKLHFKNLGVLLRLQEELDPELYDEGSAAKGDGAADGEGAVIADEAGGAAEKEEDADGRAA